MKKNHIYHYIIVINFVYFLLHPDIMMKLKFIYLHIHVYLLFFIFNINY